MENKKCDHKWLPNGMEVIKTCHFATLYASAVCEKSGEIKSKEIESGAIDND